MKKSLIFLFCSFLFATETFAQSYYFKNCRLSNAVSGDYIVNLNKKVIEVNLQTVDGKVQNFSDKIKLVEEEQITSEKIKSGKGEKIYYQYFLNSKSKSVIKLEFFKETGIDMDMFKLISKKETYCENVKGNWDKEKLEAIDADKEQEQILKAQKYGSSHFKRSKVWELSV